MKYMVLFLTILLGHQLYALINQLKSLKYANNFGKGDNYQCNFEKPRIIVLIPALREHKNIVKTIEYFNSINNCNFDIVIITTEKEIYDKKSEDRTTIDEIDFLKSKNYNFQHIHYPYITGYKADQINYVAEKFHLFFPNYEINNCFFAIYDADSRPHPLSFSFFLNSFKENINKNVFQFSSLYYSNFDIINLLPKIHAIHQTRFTFSYEISRQRKQLSYFSKMDSNFLYRFIYANCIGHGLIIRCSFFDKYKFPSNQVMEDMFYSYILNCLNEPIVSVPIFDNCEVPESFQKLFTLKARWFLGPLRSITYFNYVNKFYSEIVSKRRNVEVLIGCIYSAFTWFIKSPAYLIVYFLFIYSLISLIGKFSLLFFIVFLLTLILVSIQYYSLKLVMPHRFFVLCKNDFAISQYVKYFFAIPTFVLTHSLPTYYCIYNLCFQNGKIKKTKTERNS